MQAIRMTLIERQYSWEDAVKLASDDPSIDLSGEGPLYDPDMLEEEHLEEEEQLVAEEANDAAPRDADKPAPGSSESRPQPAL